MVDGYQHMWEFQEKGKSGIKGWFPMHEWIAENLEKLYQHDGSPEPKKTRIDAESVSWKYDLTAMTQTRMQNDEDVCVRSIRRILVPASIWKPVSKRVF